MVCGITFLREATQFNPYRARTSSFKCR